MVDETKKEWESHLNGQTTLPSCEQLMKFLEVRFRILEQAKLLISLLLTRKNYDNIKSIALTRTDDVPLGTATKSVQSEVESTIDSSYKISMEALVVRTILKTNDVKKEQALEAFRQFRAI